MERHPCIRMQGIVATRMPGSEDEIPSLTRLPAPKLPPPPTLGEGWGGGSAALHSLPTEARASPLPYPPPFRGREVTATWPRLAKESGNHRQTCTPQTQKAPFARSLVHAPSCRPSGPATASNGDVDVPTCWWATARLRLGLLHGFGLAHIRFGRRAIGLALHRHGRRGRDPACWIPAMRAASTAAATLATWVVTFMQPL